MVTQYYDCRGPVWPVRLGTAMASLDTAFKSASLNSMLQIILRFSSFVMNGVILRYIHAEILGVVNLRYKC